MTAAERGVAAVFAVLSDSEIRRLLRVEVSERAFWGDSERRAVKIEMVFDVPQSLKPGYRPSDAATLSPADVNAALAARAERLARAQSPE